MRAALILALLVAGAAHAARPVVLLTDIGMDVDDQWALAHLCASPRFDLRAVITSHAANLPAPAAEFTATAARAIVRRFAPGRLLPVLAGASVPLDATGAAHSRVGADLLRALARRHGRTDRLAVLVIGPATDLAQALEDDASLADRIEVVAMAFKRTPGDTTSWNVRQDPRAWREVMASRVPLAIGCDAVCVRDLSLTAAEASARVGATPGGRFLADLLSAHLREQGPREARRLSGRPDAWPVWDEVVVAHLCGFTTTQTLARPLTWITRVDAAALWSDLARSLAR